MAILPPYADTIKYLGQRGLVTEQADLLDQIQKLGMERTSQTYVYMLMGMEHNRELERALDTIYQMRHDGIQPSQPALITVVKLAVLFGNVDVAHELLVEAEKANQPMPKLPFICLHVLRGAALEGNYEVVKARWRVVMEKRLEPEDGLCRLALGVAARAGDAELASDIIKVVGDLGYTYHESHFVALMEAYVSALDIGSTFQVLSLMRRAGIVPGRRMAAPIVRMLGSDTNAVNEASEALKQLAAQSLPVDVAALNAVIHSFAYNGENEKAIHLYESAAELRVVPDIETIEAVLDACIHSKRAEYGRALYMKFIENGVLEPTTRTLSKMIVLECTQPDYSLALEYLQKMKQHNLMPFIGCYYTVIKKLAVAQDPRLWGVLTEMESYGFKLSGYLNSFISQHMPGVQVSTIEPKPVIPSPRSLLTSISKRQHASRGYIDSSLRASD